MSQASGNKLTGMLSGAFLPRACSLGHTLPYIARSGAGTSGHNLSGESMSIVGDMGLAVRPAVCVRDGRFHDPRLIARDVGGGYYEDQPAIPEYVDTQQGINTSGGAASL